MMIRMFEPQLGKNIEVCIDDLVVKRKVIFEQVGDLRSIFEILRKPICALMLLSALLEWDQASFWATW